MVVIERSIDHVIVLTSPPEMIEISDLLESAGFKLHDEVVEATLGIRSRLIPIGGGGFIELASELAPGSFAHGNPFEVTPRIASVSYTTMDAAADLERWRAMPEAESPMAQAGAWRRTNGTMGYFVAVMPAPPVGDIFFALQERRLFPLPFLDEAESAPPLVAVTISGADAALWRSRHRTLFSLPGNGEALYAGATEIYFGHSDAPRTQIALTFAVPNPDVEIPLESGRFEFIPSTV